MLQFPPRISTEKPDVAPGYEYATPAPQPPLVEQLGWQQPSAWVTVAPIVTGLSAGLLGILLFQFTTDLIGFALFWITMVLTGMNIYLLCFRKLFPKYHVQIMSVLAFAGSVICLSYILFAILWGDQFLLYAFLIPPFAGPLAVAGYALQKMKRQAGIPLSPKAIPTYRRDDSLRNKRAAKQYMKAKKAAFHDAWLKSRIR